MNVLKELLHSVYDLGSYPVFMKDRKRKTFFFGFLLVLLYFLLTIMVPYIRFQVSTGGLVRMADEVIPDFSIRNQSITVEHPVELDEDDTYVFINTDNTYVSEDEVRQYLHNYSTVFIVDSEKIIFQNNMQVKSIAFSEIDPDLDITKTALLEKLSPYVTAITAIILVVIFIGMLLLFFLGVLFVALLGMIVASCKHQSMTFGELYKLAIYTRTTPLLIKAVLSFLPFGIPFFFVINIAISLAYIAGAIQHMQAQPLDGSPLVFSSDQSGPVEQQPSSDGSLQDYEDRWNRPDGY